LTRRGGGERVTVVAGEHEAQEHQAPEIGPPVDGGRAGWSPPDLTRAAASSIVRQLAAGTNHGVPPVPPSALLALQRSAGNAAVHRALSPGPVLMREPTTKDPPKAPPAAGPVLPAGINFEWQRRAMSYWILIRRQWLLDRKVPPDATEITDVALIKEMMAGIGSVAPWADVQLLYKNMDAFLPVRFGRKLSEEPETLILPLADLPTKFIGNPPGEDIVVRIRKDDAIVYIDSGLLRRFVKSPKATEIVDASFTALLIGALEAAVQMPVGEGRDPGWRIKFYEDMHWTLPAPADQLFRSVPLSLAKADLLDLFGPKFEDKLSAMSGGKEAGRVKGATISLPPALEKDWPKIMAILQELVGAPDGKKKKDGEQQRSMSEKEAQLLLKIATSPLKAQIMAQLKGGGAATASGMTLSEMLETAVAQAELKQARERLHLGEADGATPDPILKRPVHGDIVLTTGRPVPDKESVFTFTVKDEVDALRVTFIQIQWFAYEAGKPKFPYLEYELNKYIPSRGQGRLNDQLFEVTFPKPGTYTIEALVNHSFYLPAAFKIDVKVLSESDEAAFQEKTALAGFATDKGAKTSEHDFDVGTVTSAVTDYEEGTITRGKLDPKFKPGTLGDRMKAIDAEIARVEKLFKSYENRQGKQAAAVANWAEEYLKTLRDGRDTIGKEAAGSRVVPCTGVYVSRSKKAPSASLDLVCLQTRTADGGYKVVLHDLTQVYEAENYRFSAENKTAEGAYEEVFVDHAASYPDGTLSVAFQGWDEKKQAPSETSFVKFRKVTDTIGKDIKSNVFDPAVNLVVNLASVVMMVVPGLQAAGFALALVWNTSQTLMDLEEKAAKGTLKDKDYVYAAASFALDLIPLAGRSARMISIGKKAFYVIEGVQLAGQVVLLSAQGMEEIEKLRNGVISKLAKVNEQIAAIEINNAADPKLDELRAQQEKLIQEGEDAVINTYGGMVAQQAIVMVAGGVIQQAAIKKFTVRVTTLESEGKFAHVKGEKTPHYDYAQRKMVGDREAMTQAEFDRVERHADLSEKLEKNVADPATRKQLVETLADEPVDIEVGGKKTRLEVEGDRQVLKVGENAKPDEILAEALRAKTGKAVKPDPKTPIEKAAYHRNELEHLAELKKMAAGEPRIDDFDVARKMKGQFDELKRTVEKMPAGKERAEMEAFLKGYEKATLEPATQLVDKVRAAGGSNGLDQFQNLRPAQRAIVADLKQEGMRRFFKLPQEKQRKLFGMTPDTIKQIHANDGPRQARLLEDIDAMARAGAQDVNYDITTGAGQVRHKEGHPFDEHGHHNTDATMFARAAAESTSKGRWESFDTQVREVEHFRQRLNDPTVPPGSPQSPINAAGAAAINNGTVTREAIMNDPLAHDQYLKSQVDFRAQPSSNNRPVGEAFHPDGTTRRPASRVTVIFQLDNAGNWQVLTGFPVE
jgi:hypothetical protein